jgi:DHA1 family bicyclomycin/chloramphenicol resistance-like MFS transporter
MTAEAKPFPMHDREFVALMASTMALNALAVDAMLPAFPAIREALDVTNPNAMQFVLSAYMISNAVGSLIAGPLADRFGRRPIMMLSIFFAAVGGLASGMSPTFEILLVMRSIHGFFAAGLAVTAISIVRDRYNGDRMAKIMSLIIIVFMIVPVLAPTIGQLVLAVASWREIFHVLAGAAVLVFGWIWFRLPETLHPEFRQTIAPLAIARNWLSCVTDRQGLGYMMAAGVMMGGMFGFLNSSQQIYYDVFDAADIFPYAFACVAGAMAAANFSNSRIVERFGARRVSHTALILFILLSLVQLGASQMHPEPLALFMGLIAINMGMVGFTGSNFGSIAMEPFGRIAGSAASFQNFARMALATFIGATTGQRFDGTTRPLAEGFVFTGLLALALVLWAERGRLFTRPRRAGLRPHASPPT